jgi:hypothetical protein
MREDTKNTWKRDFEVDCTGQNNMLGVTPSNQNLTSLQRGYNRCLWLFTTTKKGRFNVVRHVVCAGWRGAKTDTKESSTSTKPGKHLEAWCGEQYMITWTKHISNSCGYVAFETRSEQYLHLCKSMIFIPSPPPHSPKKVNLGVEITWTPN